MRMLQNRVFWMAMCLFVLACDDTASPGIVRQTDAAVRDAEIVDAQILDAKVVDAFIVDAAPPEPGWIDVRISPRRSYYTLSATPSANADVYDVFGDGYTGVGDVVWTTEPEGMATVGADGELAFLAEGHGWLVACIGEVCGRTALTIDDGLPQLVVERPARAAALGTEGEEAIEVAGRVTDGSDTVEVRVNDTIVEVADDGTFLTRIQGHFGLNRIVVTADDGVRADYSSDVRDVIWSRSYLAAEPTGLTIPHLASIRLDQLLFDDDGEVVIPDGGGAIVCHSLAQLLEVMMSVIDSEALFDPESLAIPDGVDFQIEGLALGRPDIDLLVTADGLELFLRFGEIVLTTQGALNLQGASLSLAGDIQIALAARVDMGLAMDPDVTVSTRAIDVIIESVDGQFESGALGALVTHSGLGFAQVIEDGMAQAVGGLLESEIGDLVESALTGLFDDLQNVPLVLDTGLGDADPARLSLSLVPTVLDIEETNFLRFVLEGQLAQEMAVEFEHPDPGMPVYSDEPWTELPGRGMGTSIRLGLVNGLLHEVWRAGVLSLSPDLPEEIAFLVEQVEVEAMLQPMVAPSIGPAEYPLEIQLGELLLRVRKMGSVDFDIYTVSIRSGMALVFEDGRLGIQVSERPEVLAALVEGVSDSPLPSVLLEQAVRTLVWDEIQAAVVNGLDFSLGSFDVDLGDLGDLSSRLEEVVIEPEFNRELDLREGRLALEGRLEMNMALLPIPAPEPEEPAMEAVPERD